MKAETTGLDSFPQCICGHLKGSIPITISHPNIKPAVTLQVCNNCHMYITNIYKSNDREVKHDIPKELLSRHMTYDESHPYPLGSMEDQRNTFKELNEDSMDITAKEHGFKSMRCASNIIYYKPISSDIFNEDLNDKLVGLAKTLSDHPKLNKGMNKAVGDFVNRSYPGTNGTPIEVNFHNPYTGLTSEDFIVDNEGYNKHGIKPSEGMVSFIERNPPEYNKLTKESYNKLTKESFDEFIKTLLDRRCIQIPNPLYKLSNKETADQYAKDNMLLNQGIHIDQPTTSYTRDPWQPSSIIDEKEYKISDISIPKPSVGTRFKVTYQYLKKLFNI